MLRCLTMKSFYNTGTSSRIASLILTSLNLRVRTEVHLKHNHIKRVLSTNMASSGEEKIEKKIIENQQNLLSKRFLGLESNIW